ncbi:MAG TPA: bifunctional riboflavin kinase/FAD synthetase, partial [Bacillota bacterium]|jgi:riboflavin kinase/FMN adenylyltransferase
VAIGVFDGVHLGHQKLLLEVVARAQARGFESLALTFEPHPLKVLRPAAAPALLTSFDEKVALIGATGVQTLYVQAFDKEFARTTPADFVGRTLRDTLGASLVMIGFNFSFGAGGQGTPQILLELGRAAGMQVEVMPAFRCHSVTVSSTAVRRQIAQGAVEVAAQMLGRPYVIRGTVGHGDGRGAGLGFPTANLAIPSDRVVPANGVYVVGSKVGGTDRAGVANIGRRPTFGVGERGLEVHLLDFQGDLYGMEAEVALFKRLREEMTFGSAEELKKQVNRDIRRARELLAPGLSPFYNPTSMC